MSANTASVAPGGFPVWMPSMFVKELRQGLRAKSFIGLFVTFQVLMALLMLAAIAVAPYVQNANDRAQMLSFFDSAFWVILSILLLGAIPARGMAGLRAEIEFRTLDLLLLTRLNAWRVVIGKWTSLMAQAVLVLVAMLPYGVLRYFNGAVDLQSDSVRTFLLMVGSGVLTAGALWASAFTRASAVGLGVLLLGSQVLGGIGFAQLTTPSFATSFVRSGMAYLILYCGVILLGFCLVSAVRRIAPPAENYTALVRSLGLLAFVPLPILAGASGLRSDVSAVALVFAIGLLAVICLLEFSSSQLPMPVHCRKYFQRGKWRLLFAPFVMPGWQTAILYALLAGTVLIMAVQGVPFLRLTEKAEVSWMIVLALEGLLLPALVASFLPSKWPGAARFLLVLVTMSLLTLALFAISEELNMRDLVEVAAVVPVAGFWLAMDRPPEDWVIGVQALATISILVLALLRTRPYWTRAGELSRLPAGRDPDKAVEASG